MSLLVNNINPSNNLNCFDKAQTILNSRHYKTIKYVQENEVLNRGILDLGSGFLPVVLVELFGRNWQSAVETTFGNALRVITNYLSPIALAPVWNKIAASKHELPQNIQGLSSISFEYLTPDITPEKLKERLLETKENTDIVKNMSQEDILDLKKRLIETKCLSRKLDLMSGSLLTYIAPWVRNWFSKSILGVVGFTGELNVLSDSEREQSSSFYEKFKYLLFGGGLIPIFLGSTWDTNKLKNSLTNKDENSVQGKIAKQSFDYLNGFVTSKANLLRHNLYGGVISRIFSSRSINELFEKGIRMSISLIGNFWADSIAHKTLAKRYDRKYETEIIGPENNDVKTLSRLEKELKDAITTKDESLIEKLTHSVSGQIRTYYQSMSITALATGLATAFNIWNTKRRASSQ